MYLTIDGVRFNNDEFSGAAFFGSEINGMSGNKKGFVITRPLSSNSKLKDLVKSNHQYEVKMFEENGDMTKNICGRLWDYLITPEMEQLRII